MQNEKEKPSYFSILTAEVRYDTTLSASEKLFYSEISCLCQADGYCYASNAYFAKLYNCDTRTIQRWIKNLNSKRYIRIDFDTLTNERKIFIIVNDKLNVQQRNKIKAVENKAKKLVKPKFLDDFMKSIK